MTATLGADANIPVIQKKHQFCHGFSFDWIWNKYRIPQFMYQFQFPGFTAVAEKTAETDSGKAFGKDMLQKQSNKFRTSDGFQLGNTMIRIILVTEGHRSAGDIRNPAVADCSAIGITGEILNGIPISVECLFDERKPLLFIERIYEFLPVVMVTQICTFSMQGKQIFFVVRFELFHKFTAEHLSDSAFRKEKSFVAGFSEPA